MLRLAVIAALSDLAVETLEEYIRQLTDEKPISNKKISPFLKQKFSNVKCAVLNSLPQMDPRKLFAICHLLNMKRLSRSLATEFHVAQVWNRGPPWMLSTRVRRVCTSNLMYIKSSFRINLMSFSMLIGDLPSTMWKMLLRLALLLVK